ncbi:amidohydrolase family protein [Altericroceibacterium endophyticum]|uniref:Amidohydrolase family protein n=1 Tax=Altericroceibacterium endophyticum TaxID=1808508 RepID=A0A6I4T6A2_9SPHN|nr:amidohydrolase family protein [Altericroceibacterium endophyticum]MXO65533.1 amidohydrolase family protein [Altericroceibacterium endophyticum]
MIARRLLTAISAACVTFSLPVTAAAQDLVITNARLVIGDGSAPIDQGTVVIHNGRISAAGAGAAAPQGYPVLDAEGRWVTPGLVASLTDLGLWDVGAVDGSNDVSAGEAAFSAALDIAPAINPASEHIAISRAGGVTRASVAPSASSGLFAGQGALIDLGQDPDAVMQPRAFQYVELGEWGANLAGGSRAAAYTLLRTLLTEAEKGDAARQFEGNGTHISRADIVALAPVAAGEQPLYVHVERAADIRSVLALKSEFPALDLVLVGAAEGWMVAPDIAAADVPVIALALSDLPVSFEQLAATQSNIGRMVDAGVQVALGLYAGMNQPRWAGEQAGNLVALEKMPGASGLSWDEAFAAISSVPAAIAGMDGKMGVLKPGAFGDVVIWDGDPLELGSVPVKVFVDGVDEPLDNHQTRLRDRYRSLEDGGLPPAHDW